MSDDSFDQLLRAVSDHVRSSAGDLGARRALRRCEAEFERRVGSEGAWEEWNNALIAVAEQEYKELVDRHRWASHLPISGDVPVATAELDARRQFLVFAASVTVGSHIPLAFEGDAVALGRDLHCHDADRLDAVVIALETNAVCRSGKSSYPVVVAALSETSSLRYADGPGAVRRRVLAGLGRLHSLAAWSAFGHAGVDTAREHFGHALRLAKSAGDDLLLAHVLCRQGYIYLHLEVTADALKMFQLGQLAAQESGQRLLVALVRGLQAWAYGLLGHEREMKSLTTRVMAEIEGLRFEHLDLLEPSGKRRPGGPYALMATIEALMARTRQTVSGASLLPLIDSGHLLVSTQPEGS